MSELLLQPSVAVIVNVRVGAQAVPPSAWLTLIVGFEAQLSCAVTCAFTLASVGSDPGLQPRSPPAGALVIVGLVVSAFQLYTTVVASDVLLQPSVAVIVNVRVGAQTVPPSTWLTLIVGFEAQSSCAVTCAFTLASLGNVPGLQPRSPPAGALQVRLVPPRPPPRGGGGLVVFSCSSPPKSTPGGGGRGFFSPPPARDD